MKNEQTVTPYQVQLLALMGMKKLESLLNKKLDECEKEIQVTEVGFRILLAETVKEIEEKLEKRLTKV